jgi:hypothetical protein
VSYTLLDPYVVSIIVAVILVNFVAVYLAHWRAQRIERRVEGILDDYDDVADSIFSLNQGIVNTNERLVETSNSVRMHSAQLKGAGERIRKTEGQLAANTMTIDSILTTATKPTGDVQSGVTRSAFLDLANKVDTLAIRTLGGSTSEGLPVPGEITQLRLQVEGINSNLGRQVDLCRKEQGSLGARVANAVADHARRLREKTLPVRLWRWLTTYRGWGFKNRPFAA